VYLCITVVYTSDFNPLPPAPPKLQPYIDLQISLLLLVSLL